MSDGFNSSDSSEAGGHTVLVSPAPSFARCLSDIYLEKLEAIHYVDVYAVYWDAEI